MNPVARPSKRRIFCRLPILTGNLLQAAGLLAGCWAFAFARSNPLPTLAVAWMIAGWVLFYFFCHGIAHWLFGRMLGIRFEHYTVGGTANPEGWPGGLRWIFEHLPFFGVQTEKGSMQTATPIAKAIMWSAGVTSSAVVPTLGALWVWRAGVPYSKLFFVFSVIWSLGTISSNWRSTAGDYAKARRVLAAK